MDGTTGYLCPPAERDRFVTHLAGLLTDASRRDQMSQHNTHHVKQFYVQRCAQRYQDLYEQVLQSRSGSRNRAAADTRDA